LSASESYRQRTFPRHSESGHTIVFYSLQLQSDITLSNILQRSGVHH